MKKLIQLLIIVAIPIVAFTQVEVHQGTTEANQALIPFYSSEVVQNATIKSFETSLLKGANKYGVPPQAAISPTNQDVDDTTYDANPILNYGKLLTTNITLKDGVWQTTKQGSSWVYKIELKEAFNTSLHFDNFKLSPTASMFLANNEWTTIKGAFTDESMSGINEFGTFPMDGNTCYVLINEPNAENIVLNHFTISTVVFGYEPIGGVVPPTNSTNTLERSTDVSCIPSIRCYQIWMDMAKGVSRWSNGAGSACTGTLLNNENNNGIPFYYSAHHCLPNPITNLSRSSFQFRFWQTGCNTGQNSLWIEFFGSTLLSETTEHGGDQALLRLNTGPGVGDAPTYFGWSRQNNNPSTAGSGIIHHPEAGDMRFTQPKKIRDFFWNRNFWKAYYSEGVVKPGSSGSALLNNNRQVIGTLSKGASSCNGQWLGFGDRYGKFHNNWDGKQPFLSPNNNNFDIGALDLGTIKIIGTDYITCNGGNVEYRIQNLVGCTYTWTSSPNLSIISGNGTNQIIVNSVSSQAEYGWIKVVINDSKGSIPNGRRATFQKQVLSGFKMKGFFTTGVTPTQIFTLQENDDDVNMVQPATSYITFTSPELISANWTVLYGNPTSWSWVPNAKQLIIYARQ